MYFIRLYNSAHYTTKRFNEGSLRLGLQVQLILLTLADNCELRKFIKWIIL